MIKIIINIEEKPNVGVSSNVIVNGNNEVTLMEATYANVIINHVRHGMEMLKAPKPDEADANKS